MAFKPNEFFWEPHNFQTARRCRCQFHSNLLGFDVWVSTDWTRLDQGGGTDRWEVRATATSVWCRNDHQGATDDRIITRAQWVNASPNAKFDFFPTL